MDKPTVATPHLPTREECFRAARVELDRARWEVARDYAAGLLTGDRLAAYERVRTLAAAKRAAEAAA
jgi:hypothetical protein